MKPLSLRKMQIVDGGRCACRTAARRARGAGVLLPAEHAVLPAAARLMAMTAFTDLVAIT